MSSIMEKARVIIAGFILILVGIAILYLGQTIPNQSLTIIIGIVIMIGGGFVAALGIRG